MEADKRLLMQYSQGELVEIIFALRKERDRLKREARQFGWQLRDKALRDAQQGP